MAHRELVIKLGVLAAGMFVFGFALVPLYDAFCELTGFGGKTAGQAQAVTEAVDGTRTVRIEFLASLARSAPWEFRPAVSYLDVHPGQLYETSFTARNLAGETVVAQAVPSVAPGIAAQHLRKVECFCFTTQEFQPHEERELKLVFMIDPKLSPYTDTLSLSYTLFALAE
jgi:cytochrome c oxidase assembly protein subunit 11